MLVWFMLWSCDFFGCLLCSICLLEYVGCYTVFSYLNLCVDWFSANLNTLFVWVVYVLIQKIAITNIEIYDELEKRWLLIVLGRLSYLICNDRLVVVWYEIFLLLWVSEKWEKIFSAQLQFSLINNISTDYYKLQLFMDLHFNRYYFIFKWSCFILPNSSLSSLIALIIS